MSWLTEERIAASATGAPALRLPTVAKHALGGMRGIRPIGFVPSAYALRVVCGDVAVGSTSNDHAGKGRIAWHGWSLGSPGAGNG